MKYKLCNGLCSKRFVCVNIDTKKCNVFPKENEDFVECIFFENKWEEEKGIK